MSQRKKIAKHLKAKMPKATWTQEDEERGQALLEDIEANNPAKYEELMKMSPQKRTAYLAKYSQNHREMADDLTAQIMAQKQKDGSLTAENWAGEEAEARMMALEMAQESYRQIYQ